MRHATLLTVALGFVAGYVDTVGFVALFGLFTAHVTGNFVLIGSALAQRSSSGVLLKLLVFPAFVLAVAATRLAKVALERRGRASLAPLLFLQALLLVGFACLGLAASPVVDAETALAMWAGVLGAAAMGVQNAVGRLSLSTLTPTTVMTGNVTQLVIDIVDLLRGAADDTVRQRSMKFVGPIVAFTIGAVGGGVSYVQLGFVALALPVAILVAFAWVVRSWPPATADW